MQQLDEAEQYDEDYVDVYEESPEKYGGFI